MATDVLNEPQTMDRSVLRSSWLSALKLLGFSTVAKSSIGVIEGDLLVCVRLDADRYSTALWADVGIGDVGRAPKSAKELSCLPICVRMEGLLPEARSVILDALGHGSEREFHAAMPKVVEECLPIIKSLCRRDDLFSRLDSVLPINGIVNQGWLSNARGS